MVDMNALVAANLARLREGMRSAGLDALLVSRIDHFHYATGMKTLDVKWYMHRQAAVITRDALACLPALPDVQAARETGRFSGVLGLPLSHGVWPEILAGLLSDLGVAGGAVGYDPSLPYPVVAGLAKRWTGDLHDAGEILARARAVKNPLEVTLIREALALVEAALPEVFTALRPGLRESFLSAVTAGALLRGGADGMGFPPIVSSGLNFAVPLRYATDKLIEPGELVNFCVAPLKQGYYGELHRMSATGPLSGEQAEIYRTVYAALRAGIAAIKPGRSMQALDEALRGVVRRAGYGPHEQKHVTAHGMGCNVLDFPLIGDPGAPASGRFEPGMVLHVVSGIFKPGVAGCRVSELVLVTEDGCEQLSSLEHPYLPA